MRIFTLILALALVVIAAITCRLEKSWRWQLLLVLGISLVFLWFVKG